MDKNNVNDKPIISGMRAALLLSIAAMACSGAIAATANYRIRDVGTLGGNFSSANALNATGQVAGHSNLTHGGDYHAFFWDGSAIRDLGTLGGATSLASAINSDGQIVGASMHSATSSNYHAFLWDGNTMRDLGTLGGSYSDALDINDAKHVVGYSYLPGNLTGGPFFWDGQAMVNIGCISGSWCMARDLNNRGHVAGIMFDTGANRHAFFWDGQTQVDLGSLGGGTADALALNDSDQVTGYSKTADGKVHAFIWSDGQMLDLGTVGGDVSVPSDINEVGQVTGSSMDAAGTDHGFVWDGERMIDIGSLGSRPSASRGQSINDFGQVTGYALVDGHHPERAILWDDGVLYDLNDLIDPTDPLKPYVTLHMGQTINNRGQILANGVDSRTGEWHAYLVSRPTIECTGFDSPVDMGGVANIAKAGRVVPLKFRCTKDGVPVAESSAFEGVRSVSCDGSADERSSSDTIEEYVAATGLVGDGQGNWQFNWATPKATYAGQCRDVYVQWGGGRTNSARFLFRK